MTEIGEYIRHHSCERRFKLEFNRRALAKALPFAERLFNSLDPVLQAVGRKREDEWELSLRNARLVDLTGYGGKPADQKTTTWADFLEAATHLAVGEEGYGREVKVVAQLGVFQVEGRIDFVLVLWKDGRPRLRLVESKASRRDRTYHRIQVALYRAIVGDMVAANPPTIGGVILRPEDIECVVARIEESTNEAQAILDLEPLDLDMEDADVRRLLGADGALAHIVGSPLGELSYRLESKCDGCVFNVHCLPESARLRAVELLGVEPSAARALRAAGIHSIDDLAVLNLSSPEAAAARRTPGFTEDLETLSLKARARRKTLPGGGTDPDTYEVEALAHSGQGQLPPHEVNGHRLVRVYLSVDYDYSENRIGALSAHVTKSDGQLHTRFVEADGRWQPDPVVAERQEVGRDADGRPVYDHGPVRGKDVIKIISSEWTGRYEVDSGAEKQLIQDFLRELVDAIAEVAKAEWAPIHFYVWSREEITKLVEACSRVSSQLLGHLRELLGCRESLEQLIFSSVRDEVDRRFALGWTGRGLSVVSSLRWFGRRYHWRRLVSGDPIDLDHVFTQDIFDFKTDLDLKADGSWAAKESERASTHKFEIRTRFDDSLKAPYWRAYWRTLPDPAQPGLAPAIASAIRRYNEAGKPNRLREYLRARVHALRWLEEGVRFKNADITKPLMVIADLPDFSLGVGDAAQASIDFLRLDQHVKVTNWIADHLIAPANRVPNGRTIPVMDVLSHGSNQLTATINLGGYDIEAAILDGRRSIASGALVRLTPCSADPHQAQTIGQLTRAGITCRLDSLDFATGQVILTALYNQSSRYTLFSRGATEPGDVFTHATIDESVSDFVAGRVEDRLASRLGSHMVAWLDPQHPAIPAAVTPPAVEMATYRDLLETFRLPSGLPLAPDQVEAATMGLSTRVQLLQGPPGTGKTTTTGVATLLRILARRSAGDIVLIAAHTHTAVDRLLQVMDELLPLFAVHAATHGLTMPTVRLTKVHSSQLDPRPGGGILDFVAAPSVTFVNRERATSVLLIGGTTGAILKMAGELADRRPFRDHPERFQAPMVVVDESSMMVFPHLLALGTCLASDGEMMLAGDHRQLAPILAHDWDREDRPPAVLYQPFASAYQAIQSLKANQHLGDAQILRSALRLTFRLPPLICDLIARIYRLDDISLIGLPRPNSSAAQEGGDVWTRIWRGATGLHLIVHSERQSKQSNDLEVAIIGRLLDAMPRPQPPGSIAVVTPHRAQRSLLRNRLGRYRPELDLIDTVERLQGGERSTVIVSATVSDPSAISANVEFILDLNRANVAFSRAQDRLFVVCSEALLDHIPVEIDHYESAMLWKSLREVCSHLMGTELVDGHTVRILTPPVSSPEPKRQEGALRAAT